MAINSVQIQWRRAFVMSAAVALAACSSSSTTNDGGQNVGGSGGTTLPSGSTAGLDAAVGSTQFDDSATAPLTSGFTWNECEIYNSTICGTWAWNGASNQFSATWANGAQALMTLVENDSKIVLQRTDPAGVSAGLTATYTGTRNGANSVSGTVVWTENGQPRSGTWTATW